MPLRHLANDFMFCGIFIESTIQFICTVLQNEEAKPHLKLRLDLRPVSLATADTLASARMGDVQKNLPHKFSGLPLIYQPLEK